MRDTLRPKYPESFPGFVPYLLAHLLWFFYLMNCPEDISNTKRASSRRNGLAINQPCMLGIGLAMVKKDKRWECPDRDNISLTVGRLRTWTDQCGEDSYSHSTAMLAGAEVNVSVTHLDVLVRRYLHKALTRTLNLSHEARMFRFSPEGTVTGVITSKGTVSVCERETAKNPLCLGHERPEQTTSAVGRVARINTRVFYVNQLNGFGPPWIGQLVRLSLKGTYNLNPWHSSGRVPTGGTERLRRARLATLQCYPETQGFAVVGEKVNSRKVDGVSS